MKGIVELPLAKGRIEIGYEAAYNAVKGTSQGDFIAAIVLDKDADFVVKRMWMAGFRGPLAFPSGTNILLRDGTSTKALQLAPEPVNTISGLFAVPGVAGSTPSSLRLLAAVQGLPSPYLMRAGTTAFIEVVNAGISAGNPWPADIFFVFEGFRVFPGQADPVPAKITGLAFPFYWNGLLQIPALPAGGLGTQGNIVMTGPGQGKFFLKNCVVEVEAAAAPPAGLDFQDMIGVQVQDSQLSQKLWIRQNTPPNVGPFMPLSVLTVGKSGYPWTFPRYMEGNSQITATIIFDPSVGWTAAMFPLTIKLGFGSALVP